MKKLSFIFALIIICSCNSSHSNNKSKGNTLSDTFTGKPFRGKSFDQRHGDYPATFLIIIKDCPVYSDAALHNKILMTLHVGDSVTSHDNVLLYSPQYAATRIGYKSDNDTFSGFIFYENIAVATPINLGQSGSKQYIALHFTGNSDNDNNIGVPAEALAIANGKILSKCTFKADYELGIDAIINNGGFTPPVSLFMTSSGEETDDVPHNEILFSWDGNKLDKICDNMTNFDMIDNFGVYYDYIFPSDSGSQHNKLLTIRYDEEEKEKTHTKIRYGSKTNTYSWENGKFILTEEGERIKLIHDVEPPDSN